SPGPRESRGPLRSLSRTASSPPQDRLPAPGASPAGRSRPRGGLGPSSPQATSTRPSSPEPMFPSATLDFAHVAGFGPGVDAGERRHLSDPPSPPGLLHPHGLGLRQGEQQLVVLAVEQRVVERKSRQPTRRGRDRDPRLIHDGADPALRT